MFDQIFARPKAKPEVAKKVPVAPVNDFQDTTPMESPTVSLKDATLAPARGDDVNIEAALGKIGTWKKSTGDPIAGSDAPVIDTNKVDPEILAGLAEFEAKLKETGKFAAPVGEVDPVDPSTGKKLTEDEMAKAWEEAQKAFASAPTLTSSERAKQMHMEAGKQIGMRVPNNADLTQEEGADRILSIPPKKLEHGRSVIRNYDENLKKAEDEAQMLDEKVKGLYKQYGASKNNDEKGKALLSELENAIVELGNANAKVEEHKGLVKVAEEEFERMFGMKARNK